MRPKRTLEEKMAGMERMDLPFELKALDDESGTFEGYASVFGNVDLGNDVVEPGAFKRTLDQSKGAIPILWFHDPEKPCGIGMSATEDAKGLHVKGQLDLGTQLGRDMHSGLKMGYIQSMSIGYKAIGKEIKDGIRHLTELALPEYSLLTKGFAMNPDATVVGVKAADFNSALTEAVAEADLWERRWQMQSAISDVQHELEEDDTLSDAQRVEAFRVSLSQYADAMASWFGEMLALEAPEEAAGLEEGMMAARIELEAKVGAVLSGASKQKVQAAIDALNALMDAATPPKQAPEDGSPEAPVAGSLEVASIDLMLSEVEAHLATLSL